MGGFAARKALSVVRNVEKGQVFKIPHALGAGEDRAGELGYRGTGVSGYRGTGVREYRGAAVPGCSSCRLLWGISCNYWFRENKIIPMFLCTNSRHLLGSHSLTFKYIVTRITLK